MCAAALHRHHCRCVLLAGFMTEINPSQDLRPCGIINRTKRYTHRRLSGPRYEEEAEFDAITETLKPKRLYLVPSEAAAPAPLTTLSVLSSVPWVCGFCAPAAKDAAESLWAALGQGGTPYFLKIRSRDALGALSAGSGTAASVDAFLQEVRGA